MKPESNYLSIQAWAEEDRPREKLLLKGRNVLSDAELIAILIGSGTVSLSAVDVAKLVLNKANNSLHELAKLSVKDLQKVKGIGEAKAIAIVSALELGRRRKDSEQEKKHQLRSSQAVYELMQPELFDLKHEEFWIILLNRANHVIKKERVSVGGISGTFVDPKLIFKVALEHTASSIILVHNHPSGTLKASEQDLKITKKVKEAGFLLEIPVLDHLIFTDNGYFSLADNGQM